jgi:hypothetical protein
MSRLFHIKQIRTVVIFHANQNIRKRVAGPYILNNIHTIKKYSGKIINFH